MSGTLTRISDKSRGFLNKHVLKRRPAAPARPQGAAPDEAPLTPGQAELLAQVMAQPASTAPRVQRKPEPGRTANVSPDRVIAHQAEGAGRDSPDPDDIAPAPAPAVPIQLTTYAQVVDISMDDDASSSSSEESELDYEEKYVKPVHAKIEASPTPSGMKTKPVGPEYDGEHNQRGWRGSPTTAGKTDIKTRSFTAEEQKQNELTMRKDGSFFREAGDLGGQKVGYAMDGSGRMVGFGEHDSRMVATNEKGEETAFPADDEQAILAGHRTVQPGERLEVMHHSTALGGDVVLGDDGKPVLGADGKPVLRARPVASAGFVSFDVFGKIARISNLSGHYKPGVEYLAQAIEHLLVQGAFFKEEVTDTSGRPLSTFSKEGQLFAATQKRLAAAAGMSDRITGLTAALQAAEAEGDTAAEAGLGKTLVQLQKELDDETKKITAAKDVLSKLGIGPSNRLRPGVQAEYLQPKAGATGAEVRTAQSSTMSAYDFLKTGGGNRDAAFAKSEMAQLVLARGKLRRGDLEKLEVLLANTPPWSKADTTEVLRIKNAWDNEVANIEAEARSKAFPARGGAAPEDVDAALRGFGINPDNASDAYAADGDSSSESESDSESDSEDEKAASRSN